MKKLRSCSRGLFPEVTDFFLAFVAGNGAGSTDVLLSQSPPLVEGWLELPPLGPWVGLELAPLPFLLPVVFSTSPASVFVLHSLL